MTRATGVRLDGKIAVVSGAGARIGRAIALAYAALGMTIVAAEIDSGRCAASRTGAGPTSR